MLQTPEDKEIIKIKKLEINRATLKNISLFCFSYINLFMTYLTLKRVRYKSDTLEREEFDNDTRQVS